MDQSYGREICLPEGCESESQVKHEVEECADMKYHPCEETSSQNFATSERSYEGNSNAQNIKRKYLSEQSDTSFDDSSEDLSDSEEFADLLQQCYSKSDSDVMMQSTCDDEETVRGEMSARQQPDDIEQENQCALCKKNFSRCHDLKIHIQRVHQNERQHRCTQCDKSYSIKSFLNRHIKRVHGDKKYVCDKCNFRSSNSNNLRLHISAVHLEEKPHKCPQCEACFSCKSNLVRHIMSVHNKEKPYECSACNLKFTASRSRDVHWSSVHCGEKPYSCDQCDYKCSKKSNLTKHQRVVHDGVKPFACTECEYKSSTKSHLKQHLIAVHYQQKPHSCNECGKAFSQASHLKKHVDAVHKWL